MKLRIAIVVTALLALAAGLTATLVTRFDPQAATEAVRDYVREQYGRELRLEGPLALTLWPVLSIAVPRATLSEVGSEQQAARLERATVDIAWLPLLRGRVIVERARLVGLHLIVERRADGTHSIDNLIGPLSSTPDAAPGDEPPARAPRIEFGKIELSDASIDYTDPDRQRMVWLDDIELKLDELDSKMVTPMTLRARVFSSHEGISALVRAAGTLDLDLSKRTIGVRGAEASLRGFKEARPIDINARARRVLLTLGRPGTVGRIESFAIGLKASGQDWTIDTAHARGASLDYDSVRLALTANAVEVSARGRHAGDTFEVAVALPDVAIANPSSRGRAIEASARLRGTQELDLKLTLDGLSGGVQNFSASRVSLAAESTMGTLQAGLRLTGALRGDLDAASLNLGQIAGTLTLDPGGSLPELKLPLTGSVHTEASVRIVDADIETRLDSSLVRLRSRFDPSRPEGSLAFNFAADQLDVDRIIGLLSPIATAVHTPVRRTDTPAQTSAPPAGLATRDTIQRFVEGNWGAEISIGQLKANWLRAAAVNLSLQSVDRAIRMPSLALSMHGGTVTGRGEYHRPSERFTISTEARAIDTAALLDTLGQPRRLEGPISWRGDLSGQLNGNSVANSLQGNLTLSVGEGRLNGIDLLRGARETAQRLRALRSGRTAPVDDSEPTPITDRSSTEFNRLAASVSIRDGKAHSRDLLIDTPVLKASGGGTVDLQQQTIDVGFRVGVTRTAGDPLLGVLSRVSLPVQLQGSLMQPQWRIDTTALFPQTPRPGTAR